MVIGVCLGFALCLVRGEEREERGLSCFIEIPSITDALMGKGKFDQTELSINTNIHNGIHFLYTNVVVSVACGSETVH